MAIVSARCFVASFVIVLLCLFIFFLYLMATIDPVPPGYIVGNSTDASVNPVVTRSGRRSEDQPQAAEVLFSLESPNKVRDSIIYGPFPIVFDDPSSNNSMSSVDGKYTRKVYPPIVPMIERHGNKTVVKSMILSKLEPKTFQRRSANSTNQAEKIVDTKIIDEIISNFEIKVPIDPVVENENFTVQTNVHEAGYDVFVNGRKYNVSEVIKTNASISENRNIIIAVNKSDSLTDFLDENKIPDLQHKEINGIKTNYYDIDDTGESEETFSSENTTVRPINSDSMNPNTKNGSTLILEKAPNNLSNINSTVNIQTRL